jgi:hypothetical protein
MHFPSIELNTPRGCAELLARYARNLIRTALPNPSGPPEPKIYRWDAEPHHIFYSESGDFRKMKFPIGTAGWEAQMAKGLLPIGDAGEQSHGKQKPKTPPAPKKKTPRDPSPEPRPAGDRKGTLVEPNRPAKVQAGTETCGWNIAGLLGLKNKDGQALGCNGKECRAVHIRNLSEITRIDAAKVITRWGVRESLRDICLEAVYDYKHWKEA